VRQTRLALALDVHDAAVARQWARRLRGQADILKVGLQLFIAQGPDLVLELRDLGWQIFLDLKIHDIPATAERAVRAAARLGVAYLTVHTSGGSAMLQAAAAGRSDTGTPRLLGVTVLTSLSGEDLARVGCNPDVEEAVRRRCCLARAAGCDGVVASAREAAAVRRQCGEGFIIVTPGVRPAGSGHDDQARVMTPAAAARAGADIIVVGRPILQAEDPELAAHSIRQELASALEEDGTAETH